MSVYNFNGSIIQNVYDLDGLLLSQAYDLSGTELMGDTPTPSPDEPFVKTTLAYDSNYMINTAWLNNATTQRNALIQAYNSSNDSIPFFIQTDGHGRYNEGNKGCHNIAEATMGYIRNIQLGDYASYYSNGNNPSKHNQTKQGIEKYLSVMGNHEFLNNNSADAELADLPTLINSYTPNDAILCNQIYGDYKVLDAKYNVKYLVPQPYKPDETSSKGFIWRLYPVQYEWIIDELEANDGYDIVYLQHQAVGTDTLPILQARKNKESGTFTDSQGNTYSYDFSNTESELLCTLHGHHHAESYVDKETRGFPTYVADWFGNDYTCTYGLIDRANKKLMLWKFSRSSASNVLELDL